MIKIAITGPESSGKTTLSANLAQHFKAPYVQEFSRAYLTNTEGEYEQSDLDRIAEGQMKANCALTGVPIMIADTEMLVMKIWSLFKYGKVSSYIELLWDEQDFDLYVLCSPDIPYEQDDLRESPEHREELFEMYLSELKRSGRKFIVAKGDIQSRMNQVIAEIQQLKEQ